eukprot:3360424-Pyramimonas_sp.AAC.1
MPEPDAAESVHEFRRHIPPPGPPPVPRLAAVLFEDVLDVGLVVLNPCFAPRCLEGVWRQRRPPVADHG